ncbi:glycosyltransferase [Niveibacterium sp.]|uniref:glycosyltransferase n=1 Tax=Niveibacterium sp. TaxID=2017444 RepID=UPI0035AFE939
MKVLLTVHQFFPEYFSGTEVLTYSVARELIRRGHQVAVYTGYPARELLPDDDRFDEYEIDGIKVYRFHHAYALAEGQSAISEVEYNNHLSARYFSGLVDRLQPDCVHFFHLSRLGAGLIDVVHGKGVAAYYTPTDFWSVCPTSQLLLGDGSVCAGPVRHGGNCVKHVAALTGWRSYAGVVKRLPDIAIDAVAAAAKSKKVPDFPFRSEIAALSRRVDFNVSRLNTLRAIISPTELMTRVLQGNGVSREKIVQSAYGIDISGFDGADRSPHRGGSLTVGYIGTLAPHKGCHVLIDAVKGLGNCGVTVKIYGNPHDFPDYYSKLRGSVAGVESIEFCGTFSNGDIAEVLGGLDVLVVPSVWYENTPLVVYSALAAKCPVVASNFPGMSEVVLHESNGLLFEPSDANELRQCLARLAGEDGLVDRLSRNCRPPKSIATYVDEVLEVYDKTRSAESRTDLKFQTFEPFLPVKSFGSVAGWVVVAGLGVKSLKVLLGGEVIGVAHRFMPRQDVARGLASSGVTVEGDRFGFAFSLTKSFDWNLASIEVEAVTGQVSNISCSRLSAGAVVQFEGSGILAFDRIEQARDA